MNAQIDGTNFLRFTVVVPVFNCSNYIGHCIESILTQNYDNLELLIVDDGSTDDSYEICCRYSLTDARVRVIRKENGGPLSARLAAYPYTNGDYVLHVDADDALAPYALSRLAEVISRHSVDVVFFEFSLDEDFAHIERRFPFPESTFFGSEEKSEYLNLALSNSCCLNTMWSKAIKADYLTGLECPADMRSMVTGEDLLQSLYILNETSTAYYLNETLYYYRENPTGTTGTFRYGDHKDHEVFYRRFHELLDCFCAVPGFVLTDTDNDRDFMLSCFRYLQKAARQGASVFSRASDIVRNSKALTDALRNESAKKSLRSDAVCILSLVTGNSNRLAYTILVFENGLHDLVSRRNRKHH